MRPRLCGQWELVAQVSSVLTSWSEEASQRCAHSVNREPEVAQRPARRAGSRLRGHASPAERDGRRVACERLRDALGKAMRALGAEKSTRDRAAKMGGRQGTGAGRPTSRIKGRAMARALTRLQLFGTSSGDPMGDAERALEGQRRRNGDNDDRDSAGRSPAQVDNLSRAPGMDSISFAEVDPWSGAGV